MFRVQRFTAILFDNACLFAVQHQVPAIVLRSTFLVCVSTRRLLIYSRENTAEARAIHFDASRRALGVLDPVLDTKYTQQLRQARVNRCPVNYLVTSVQGIVSLDYNKSLETNRIKHGDDTEACDATLLLFLYCLPACQQFQTRHKGLLILAAP